MLPKYFHSVSSLNRYTAIAEMEGTLKAFLCLGVNLPVTGLAIIKAVTFGHISIYSGLRRFPLVRTPLTTI